VDPFAYLPYTEDIQLQKRQMSIESKEMTEAPMLEFSLSFPQLLLHEGAFLTFKRRDSLEALLDRLKSDLKDVHSKLIQQTEAFASIRLEGRSLVIYTEQPKSCFAVCATANKEKRCLLM
jgi:hypothetical protein